MSDAELSARLRRLRKLAGKTQAAVAAELGISKATYSSWETGRNEVRGSFVVPLCRSLLCSPNDLFGYAGDGASSVQLDDAYLDWYGLYARTPRNVRAAVRVILEDAAKARVPRHRQSHSS